MIGIDPRPAAAFAVVAKLLDATLYWSICWARCGGSRQALSAAGYAFFYILRSELRRVAAGRVYPSDNATREE